MAASLAFTALPRSTDRGRSTTRFWERLIQPEKNNDPDKKGYGVLIRVERAEDLAGNPLQLD